MREKKKEGVKQDLQRRKNKVEAAEKRQASALMRYQDKVNYIIYHTREEVMEELEKMHNSGKPKYTLAMKIEIVEKQIQYRRDCLLRKIKPGSLCSDMVNSTQAKLDALLTNLSQLMVDEFENPRLKLPPQIRKVSAMWCVVVNLIETYAITNGNTPSQFVGI